MDEDFYVPSLSVGKHWRVQLHQPAGHVPHIGAVEGRLVDGQFCCDAGVPRSTIFNVVHHCSASATLKELLCYMAHNRYIARESAFRCLLCQEYETLFSSDPEYAYAAKRTTPADLAAKMAEGLKNGSANKDGRGIKGVCKALGIPHTYKAIAAYLAG